MQSALDKWRERKKAAKQAQAAGGERVDVGEGRALDPGRSRAERSIVKVVRSLLLQ